jgi:hypothetical protein
MKGLRLISTPLEAANKAHTLQSTVQVQIVREEQKISTEICPTLNIWD